MIGSRDPIRRLAVAGVAVLVAALMLAACRSSSDTPSPSASQSPTDVPPTSTANAGSPSATSSPGGSPSATPGATASPPPSGAIDDLAWTTSPAGLFGAADVISDAAVIDATIVAVGSRVAEAEDDISGAAAWYSSDGLSWQAAAVAGAEAASMESVVAGPAGLVAVGYVSTDIDDMPRAWLSSDGHSWEQVSSATFTRGQMTAVAADASGYLAVGLDYNDGTSLAWTSSDGHSWSAAETIPVTEVGDAINGVIAAAGGFLCFGSTADGRAAMWLRAAGTWQQIEGFEALADVNDVLVTPAGLMAVGAGYEGELAHTVVWTSSDGQAWAREPAGEQPGEMSAVEMLGSGYLAVGSRPEADELVFGAAAWSSADGRTWQPLAEDASFEFARIFELLRFGPGAVALGERALDQAGEELAPMTWLATPR